MTGKINWLRFEPNSAKVFTELVYLRVKTVQPEWSLKDVQGWLKEVLPVYRHPDFSWTVGDALDLGDIFLEESSTW